MHTRPGSRYAGLVMIFVLYNELQLELDPLIAANTVAAFVALLPDFTTNNTCLILEYALRASSAVKSGTLLSPANDPFIFFRQ